MLELEPTYKVNTSNAKLLKEHIHLYEKDNHAKFCRTNMPSHLSRRLKREKENLVNAIDAAFTPGSSNSGPGA